ncbi:MAG: ERCC4 domain-containing protein [Bacillota bacterium]|nr:ERCC4 domain-containing protein [Bacillota bacterium]
MQIQIDSREKSRAIKKIVEEFERQDVRYFVSKLYVGDYINMERPLVIIDRKQNIAEIAANATSGHKRVKKELERLDEMGAKMYFLIEQDRIDGKPITCLEDIMLWEPKYGEIIGERVYRILKSWEYKHNIEYVFCCKRNTGKEIIRLLRTENSHDN